MLRMDQVHVIRHKVLVEGQSIRSVAREMSIGRNTIKKYLELSEPVRVVRQKKPSPVMEMVAPRIDKIVEEWRGRTTAKQRITGSLGSIGSSSRRATRSASRPSGTTCASSAAGKPRCSSGWCTALERKRRWTSSR